MVTTRSDTLKARRVLRSSTATRTGSSGITKREAPAAPKKIAPKKATPNKAIPKKQNASKPKSALGDPATDETNRELGTGTINNDTIIKPVTRSMAKKVNQTATVELSTLSSVKKPSVKGTTRPNASAPPASRPITRSMRSNDESSTINAPPGPDTHARENLAAPSPRVTRRMARENTLVPSPSTTNAPVVDVGARDGLATPRTTVTSRAPPVRPGPTVSITANQERHWAVRNRASLRRALEGDQEWLDLAHGQRREMVRLFAWVSAEPGRTHHDYFNLPVHHEALTLRPNVELSVIPRVRAWFEDLKMGNNEDDEEAAEEA